MRLSRIEFTNFRCFTSEAIEISNYTSLVGPNNCGKSTVLRALNIFFGEGGKAGAVQASDFSVGNLDKPLSLLFEFSEVEGPAEEALSHYVRDGKVLFEIVASMSEEGLVSSKCRGIRYGLLRVAPFFAAQRATDRKPLYESLVADGADLPKWKNLEEATAAVREYEKKFPEEFERLASEENAYGATGPVPILRRYLDWIYVPAVKDASAEASELRNSAFSKLIIFAIRAKVNFDEQISAIRLKAATQLKKMLVETEDIVNEVGAEIDREFRSLSTTPVSIALKWDDTESIVLKEPNIRSMFKDGDLIESPEHFGHGIQRTYIMALLSVATKVQSKIENFKLIIGIEEPELYQHPPQAKFLSGALSDLADGNAQVLVTTHSPYFLTGRTFESIRSLKKKGNVTKIHSWSIDEQRQYCAARKGNAEIGANAALSGMDKSLRTNIAEMFFASKVVLVEGPEDEALITAYLKWKDLYSEFLMAGGHIVPTGGKSKMPMLIALARGMSIDVYSAFDFDMGEKAADRGNSDLIKYAEDVEAEIPLEISEDFASDYFFASFENIQSSISKQVPAWQTTLSEIAAEWGWNLAKLKKDPMLLEEAISRTTMATGEIPSIELLVSKLRPFWSQI